MKKIAFINTSFSKGGAASIACRLFYGVEKRDDYEAYFFYGRGKKTTKPHIIKFSYVWETVLHILLVRFLGLDGFGSYFSTKKLISLLKEKEINIIHLHNIHGYYLNFPLLFSFIKNQNIKVIWTLHDEWILTSLKAHSGGCMHCFTGSGVCTSLYSYPRSYFPIFQKYVFCKKQEYFLSSLITFISPAEWLLEKIKKSYLSTCNSQFIYNGVDTSIFTPQDGEFLKKEIGVNKDVPIVLFVDSADRNKRREDIFLLMGNFLQLIFLGVGGKKKKLANYIGLGHISHSHTLASIYTASSVLCYPSLYETLPTFVLEAMSCGIPVIGYDTIFMKELVFKNNCGFLVSPGDIDALRDALDKLLSNPELLHTFSQNARRAVLENYTLDVMYKKYINLYEN